MRSINFTGDFSILKKKGFMQSIKDPFYGGTLQKPLGSGKILLIRENGEVRMSLGILIYPEIEQTSEILKKLDLPFEIVDEED